MKRMLCTSLALLMSGVQAMADDLPKSLFGVALGEVYSTSGDTFENHTFPVDKLTGASKFLGEGMHLYFKPKQENPAFPYKALPPEDDSPYHKTSHHLYVLPVIPEGIDSLEAYQALDKHEWMVVSIDWYERSQEVSAKPTPPYRRCTLPASLAIFHCREVRDEQKIRLASIACRASRERAHAG